MDWITQLECLQAVLKEFDITATPNKDILIWYFQDGLKPSIHAPTQKWDWNLENWQKVIKKPIDAEVIADKAPPSLVRKKNTCCPCDYWQVKGDEWRD